MTREEATAALEQVTKFLDLLGIDDPPFPPRLEEATDIRSGDPLWEIHVRTAPGDIQSGPAYDTAVAAIAQVEALGRDLGFRSSSSDLDTTLIGKRTVPQ